MPLYLINARDKADSQALRQATREAHLAYARGALEQIRLAGPVLNEAGDMVGSTFVMAFDTLDAAKAWAAKDPYALAGLFETVEVIEYKWLIGDGEKPDS